MYDGQRNCPKHVEVYSKNKFEKLVHLVGFIVRSKWKIGVFLKNEVACLRESYETHKYNLLVKHINFDC